MEQALDGNQTRENRVQFDGKGAEFFKIILVNLLLTLCTFGIYHFWGIVRTRKFLYQHTAVADGRFDYHVTGKEKFIAFIKALVMVSLFLALVYGIITIITSSLSPDVAMGVTVLVFYLLAFMIGPLLSVAAHRFNLSRTSWNSVRFRFGGKVMELYKVIFKFFVFGILTLGLYTPWGIVALQRFFTQNTWLGNRKFEFEGKGKALLLPILVVIGCYILGFGLLVYDTMFKIDSDPDDLSGDPNTVLILFFTIIIIFLSIFWFSTWLYRYFWNNTRVGENKISCDISFPVYLGKTIMALLLTVVTLGFGFPWAIVMLNKYALGTIAIKGDINPASLVGDPDSSETSAFAEAVGEAGSFLDTIADFIS